jgi:hypothetical protein
MRPIVLSTAKVISYEDLATAYAERAEQEEKAVARKKKAADARAKRAEQEERGKVTKSRKRACSRKRKAGSSRVRDPSAEPGVETHEQRVGCDHRCKPGSQDRLRCESDCTMPGKSTDCADVVKGARQVRVSFIGRYWLSIFYFALNSAMFWIERV